MADESLLDGLDHFGLLDHEADRVHRRFLSSPDWSQTSRCEGWSTRDMLGNLTGLEDYTRAGLDGRVQDLFRAREVAGALDVGAFNDWQISTYADVPLVELLGRWREARWPTASTSGSRGRSGLVNTSVGDYSSWLQTFHYAVEYATHGDDVFVPVPDSERAERTEWRAVFGQLVLQELEKPVMVERGLAVVVTSEAGHAELTPEEFVEATQGRLSADHSPHPELRKLLATVYVIRRAVRPSVKRNSNSPSPGCVTAASERAIPGRPADPRSPRPDPTHDHSGWRASRRPRREARPTPHRHQRIHAMIAQGRSSRSKGNEFHKCGTTVTANKLSHTPADLRVHPLSDAFERAGLGY